MKVLLFEIQVLKDELAKSKAKAKKVKKLKFAVKASCKHLCK